MAPRSRITGVGGPTDLLAPYGKGSGQNVCATCGAPGGGTSNDPTHVHRVSRALQVYLPEVYPIPDATNFNTLGSVNSAGPQSNILLPGASVQLPKANTGYIRSVSINIANMLQTTNVTWTVFINTSPVPGFTNLSIFPRVADGVTDEFDCVIRVSQGALVTIRYSNLDGGTYGIGASLSGWYQPLQSAARWTALGPPYGGY